MAAFHALLEQRGEVLIDINEPMTTLVAVAMDLFAADPAIKRWRTTSRDGTVAYTCVPHGGRPVALMFGNASIRIGIRSPLKIAIRRMRRPLRLSAPIILAALMLTLFAPGARGQALEPASSALAARVAAAAEGAPAAAKEDGMLYGMQRWHAATQQTLVGLKFPGLLSCAYTVSAILREAGHAIGQQASVAGVDTALSAWPKVTDPQALLPGDVVFWKPRPGSFFGIRCPSTHWHVGIFVGSGDTVDNDWLSGLPARHSLSRACLVFAYGRRHQIHQRDRVIP